MGGTAGLITAGVGAGVGAIGQVESGHAQQMASMVDAGTIAQTATLNSQLIEQGSELNAGVEDFNAAALEAQGKDAITQGAEQETIFRQQLQGTIATQRAEFAGQGVDVGSGSALDVQKDTAYQGELDALTIRTNAARAAWGFTTNAQSETLTANATRTLGKLQSENTLEVGNLNAQNARMGGTIKETTANFGAASTILTGTAAVLNAKYN